MTMMSINRIFLLSRCYITPTSGCMMFASIRISVLGSCKEKISAIKTKSSLLRLSKTCMPFQRRQPHHGQQQHQQRRNLLMVTKRINNNTNNCHVRKMRIPYRGKNTSSSSSRTRGSTRMIEWPKSINDFCVNGTPILLTLRNASKKNTVIRLDFGTFMLNFGAVTSLSGFMMTDVLYLRSLSIVGSVSGIIYNLTRRPAQMNAVAWGGVFIAVNAIQIIRLILERQEIKFTIEEATLYYKNFEPFGVEAKTFQNLMKSSLAQWKTYDAGKVIVSNGKPLGKVLIVVDGKATAHQVIPTLKSSSSSTMNIEDDDTNKPKKEQNTAAAATAAKTTTTITTTETKPLYSYVSGENGKIIGATGLVDPDLIGKNYPNLIITDTKTRILSFDTKKLCEFLVSNDASVEAAIFHMMYVDLVGSLRRHRTVSGVGAGIGMAVHDLKIMLQQACADGIIHPAERRLIRQFMEKYSIDDTQLFALLECDEVGWTKEEWKDGAKLEVMKEQEQTEQELGKVMQLVLSDIK